MADVLDRIDKLMALALNNPNAEEARSAAMTAVKAIREHKVTLSVAQPLAFHPQAFHMAYAPPPYTQAPPYQPPAAPPMSYEDFVYWMNIGRKP